MKKVDPDFHKKNSHHVRLDDEQERQLQALAHKMGLDVAPAIRFAIKQAYDREMADCGE